MSRNAYRAASCLDGRAMHLAPDGFVMPHAHLERWTQAITDAPVPIHFIFHAGHVGSTLLSRAIGEADGVLGLREPATLRTLAAAHDALGGPNRLLHPREYETWFATHLRLWRRGYHNTRCVVLKTTSDTARIGHKLMSDATDARAILLNVTPETYLAQALSADSTKELQSKLPGRVARLARLLGNALDAGSSGEAVALSWLTEQLTHDRIAHPWPHRALRVDFDAFLANPGIHLAAIFCHLQLEMPQALRESDLSEHPLMRQYSKSPERAHSIADRAERLAWSRKENAREISNGLAWLEHVARSHPHAALALAA
ncbi:MAG: hypothetical protein JSS00_15400 [Proteobacteria bacterium]|nr:hypothetical protein [Pseudomonadota bacterium]